MDRIIRLALQEDAVYEDVTTQALIPKQADVEARFLAKEDMVLCGLPLVQRTLEIFDAKLKLENKFQEGNSVKAQQVLAKLSGSARSILSLERVCLNFLQRLSGIATLTHKFVEQMRGTSVQILDTRKTTPTLRVLERYAVRVGGGVNHRFDLKSAVMVKDNHLALIGSMEKVMKGLSKLTQEVPVVVEAKTLDDLQKALQGGATHVQLDNMGLEQLRKAVELAAGKCKLEATGGINLHNARAIAKTGVDFISVGMITHSAAAVDISLEFL
jgi:nicotinate-nucleotide pyrophosphorylase (carboxylating)